MSKEDKKCIKVMIYLCSGLGAYILAGFKGIPFGITTVLFISMILGMMVVILKEK